MVALIGVGALRSVVDLSTVERIACAAGHKLQLTTSRRKFRFGITVHDSLGSFKILIPTSGGFMRVCPHVIKADIPFLLGLEALDQN